MLFNKLSMIFFKFVLSNRFSLQIKQGLYHLLCFWMFTKVLVKQGSNAKIAGFHGGTGF
jgi:hypothetical protein